MELDGKEIKQKISLNKSADMDRLAKIIVSRGGNVWSKKGKRAYFSNDVEDFVRWNHNILTPFWDVYVDLDSHELVLSMCDQDIKYYDEPAYKAAILDFLKKSRKA